ncbi:MAG: DUF4062 domain-containing protein [Chloroflexi bacterium]|nr:DUF4062 domain-containing protein [Chloroflexota bacterium]
MGKIKVFISSALDELEYEREIATRVIRSLGFEPLVFEGFPAMSKSLEDAYVDEVRACDVFVLILWKDLRPAVEREYMEAMRGNKSILIFVKMLKEGEQRSDRLQAFLGNLKDKSETASDAGLVRFYKHYRSLADLEESLRDGIVGEVNRKLARMMITTSTRQDMYELGVSITLAARKRLYVAQQTPSLLFGPRDYLMPETEKVSYELAFYRALRQWVAAAVDDKDRECICLYNAQSSKIEAEKHQLQDRVKVNMNALKRQENQSGHRVRFSSTLTRFSGPIAVGDNWFAIWVMGDENAVAISSVSEQVSDALAGIFRQLGSRITTTEELLKELGIAI